MADFQRNIWAPWRMEYIDSLVEDSDGGCFLCHIREHAQEDEHRYVLWRSPQTLVLLNRFPYSSGHVLIAPVEHVPQLDDLPDTVLLELMHRTRDVRRILEHALQAQGFNVGINLGRCAGAGLPGHLHIHVVPRWGGDTNFMAVLADVKVIPQSLTAVRRLFLDAAGELGLDADQA